MTDKSQKEFLVTPHQTLAVANQAGLSNKKLALSGLAVLTFSKLVMDRLEELCALTDLEWISSAHHPYAAPNVIKAGTYEGMDVTVLIPSMGASPMACVVEDLVICGAEAIFLVCPAWSLGSPLQFGDLIIPTFSVGSDGTSIHYGNTSGHVEADPVVIEALGEACRERDVIPQVGGNASCEALYRVTPQMVVGFKAQGCLCMENGEASTLFAMGRDLGFLGGVLFQPYIDLMQGWDPSLLPEDAYRRACALQAEVTLRAGTRLMEQGYLKPKATR